MKNLSFLFLAILVLFSTSFAQVKVLSSTTKELIFEYSPEILDTSVTFYNNRKFISISFRNASEVYLEQSDKYRQPLQQINIGVPQKQGNYISIIQKEYSTLNGIFIPRSFQSKQNEIDENTEYWEESNGEQVVSLGDFGIIRSMPVQTLLLSPISYNKKTESIEVLKRLVCRITFSSQNQNSISSFFDDHLKAIILNYEAAKNWVIESTHKRLQKIESSILASGTWYRFLCPQEGIYKIDKNMINEMGIDADNVDPRMIRIFNNGGYQLDENIPGDVPVGLNEVAIYISGENDGSFDSEDFILLYGRGTEFWEYSIEKGKIARCKNQFSKKNFFWITTGNVVGKRMEIFSSSQEENPSIVNTSRAFAQTDRDLMNIGKTGRDWFGDKFTPTSPGKTYETQLENVVSDSLIKYNYRLANCSGNNILLSISESNNKILSANMAGTTEDYYLGIEFLRSADFYGDLSGDKSRLNFSVSTVSNGDEIYLDYFEIEYWKRLEALDDTLMFFAPKDDLAVQYELEGFSNNPIYVFDISDYANVRILDNVELNNGKFTFQTYETSENTTKYYALTSLGIKVPIEIEEVESSNISGITGGAEFVIISHPDFISGAQELSNYRNSNSTNQLSSLVININDILF